MTRQTVLLSLRKIDTVVSLSRDDPYRSMWVGGNGAGNDTFVWIGTGDILPDDSDLWETNQPNHGSDSYPKDCLMIYIDDDALYTSMCSAQLLIVCEADIN